MSKKTDFKREDGTASQYLMGSEQSSAPYRVKEDKTIKNLVNGDIWVIAETADIKQEELEKGCQ